MLSVYVHESVYVIVCVCVLSVYVHESMYVSMCVCVCLYILEVR